MTTMKQSPKLLSNHFASDVFSIQQMKMMLSSRTFEHLHRSLLGQHSIQAEFAEEVAQAMKTWAMEKGATHFCHWFQPWTGKCAEKQDAFLDWGNDGEVLQTLSGKALMLGEPDASSLPSGGIRNTYEARGYTCWDPTSPAFIWRSSDRAVLCIPSLFFSWSGEILDTKIPLLRSDHRLKEAYHRLQTFLKEEKELVFSTLGAEQEFFLISDEEAKKRMDLRILGFSLQGADLPKGQELEDHYFGSIPSKALEFMSVVEEKAHALGIPIKTRHNEVAPNQYEMAPLFEPSSIAVDHNLLLMELMRTTAQEMGLKCLFHEKPFEGINGSGKHLNWSMITKDGKNLLSPGDLTDPSSKFLVLLTAVLYGVYKHAGLLRASVGHLANDRRLGGNEAPPGVISVYLGSTIEDWLDQIMEGKNIEIPPNDVFHLGLPSIPEVYLHDTDRNRTSPFAFTGNKFEFRAAGSSQSPAFPMTVLNVIIADALNEIMDDLEESQELLRTVRKFLHQSQDIRYLGDNYSKEWFEEAKKRQLPFYSNSLDSYQELLSVKSAKAFEEVLTNKELKSLYEVLREQYLKQANIEGRILLQLAKQQVLPAALDFMQKRMQFLQEDPEFIELEKSLQKVKTKIHTLLEFSKKLEKDPGSIEYQNQLKAALNHLEKQLDHSLWPYPKLWEILYL